MKAVKSESVRYLVQSVSDLYDTMNQQHQGYSYLKRVHVPELRFIPRDVPGQRGRTMYAMRSPTNELQ